MGLKVKKECCGKCLYSKNKIVSSERKKEIIVDCLQTDTHFECHEGTIEGKEIVCAEFYKRQTSQGIRIAQRLGQIEMVD